MNPGDVFVKEGMLNWVLPDKVREYPIVEDYPAFSRSTKILVDDHNNLWCTGVGQIFTDKGCREAAVAWRI